MSGLLILSVGCLLMWYANSFPTPLTPLSISNADLNILGPVE
jgi:hypothetical protein